jgi:hypothetical protein
MALLLVLTVLMLLAKHWHHVVAALVLYLVWRWGVEPWREARVLEARDRLRHARARREIDRITFETARAMHEAAGEMNGEIIESTAVEVRGE